MDFPGAALILAAVCCYILAVQDGGSKRSWNSAHVVGLLVGFVLIVIVFAIVQYFQAERALLQPRLMKDRALIASCLFMALYVFRCMSHTMYEFNTGFKLGRRILCPPIFLTNLLSISSGRQCI